MCVMQRILAVLLCLGLGACSAFPTRAVSRADSVGLTGGWSQVERVSQSAATRHHVIVARSYWIDGPNGPVQTLRLGKLWDGVHDRLRVDGIFAGGIALPYQASARSEPFTHDMADHVTLIGTLDLSRPQARAIVAGSVLTLIGPDGTFDITLPASLIRRHAPPASRAPPVSDTGA